MQRRTVVIFAMSERGHMETLLPLVSGLAALGASTHVFTDRRFEREIRAAGAAFHDLYAGRPLATADDASSPFPCRYVSFAGVFADDVLREVAPLRPDVIVYETFAVIGRVVGAALSIPYVNVGWGHAVEPEVHLHALASDPRVRTADACRRAVASLRERSGCADASEFAYITGLSPFLNVQCEPPEIVSEAPRARLEPVAFFGSLPVLEGRAASTAAPGRPYFAPDAKLRIYASFGTVVWSYYTAEALAALAAVAAYTARHAGTAALVGLGDAPLGPEAIASLERRGVTVLAYPDQWQALREADLFVTHHGLRSTHEAIYHRVPMLGYPFFSDQPAFARRCAALGLSIPLALEPRAPIDESVIESAIERYRGAREAMAIRLSEARAWEIATYARRPDVCRRILEL